MSPSIPFVYEIMSVPVVVIAPERRVSDVFELSRRSDVHHFPVVEGGSLVAFVCTCDLRDAAPDMPVSAFARSAVTISATSSAEDAARLVARRAVGSVVVIDDREVAGIVTREDLARLAPELAPLLAEGHCAACNSSKHLRPGLDAAFLCTSCLDRARQDNWFDVGVGD
jgi:predicted transcriptional regulator